MRDLLRRRNLPSSNLSRFFMLGSGFSEPVKTLSISKERKKERSDKRADSTDFSQGKDLTVGNIRLQETVFVHNSLITNGNVLLGEENLNNGVDRQGGLESVGPKNVVIVAPLIHPDLMEDSLACITKEEQKVEKIRRIGTRTRLRGNLRVGWFPRKSR